MSEQENSNCKNLACKVLQALESLKMVEKDPNGGRRLTSQGTRDLDRIAGQVWSFDGLSGKQDNMHKTTVIDIVMQMIDRYVSLSTGDYTPIDSLCPFLEQINNWMSQTFQNRTKQRLLCFATKGR